LSLKTLNHVIQAEQFNRSMLEELFVLSGQMEKMSHKDITIHNKIMISLFYEPSTRTRFSFESAMFRLGGTVITTENAREFSSGSKGETLEDTIRVISGYGDVIVIRHYEAGAAQISADVSTIPVINAGDGAGQHPTQSLLDIYTIYKELGRIDDVKIAMVGDLANGRTVRSLSKLMAQNCKNIKIYYVSPDNVKIKDDIKEYLQSAKIDFVEESDLRKVAKEVDIIYQTRIQRERFKSSEEYEKTKGIYIINKEILSLMKEKAIILHPLPRVDEITYEVDHDPRAAYFRQAHNGLFVRMALLKVLLRL
jgi:aspartate carbamoyltransferase catalytic subunit